MAEREGAAGRRDNFWLKYGNKPKMASTACAAHKPVYPTSPEDGY